MKAFLIPETGDFMRKLLLQDVFDKFELVEGEVTTMVTWTVDGSLHKEFYGEEEETDGAPGRDSCLWGEVRPVIYEMIKGKKLPVKFSFVLRLPDAGMQRMLEKHQLTQLSEALSGLFLNIRYQKQTLTCTSGLSYRTFVMDKSMDKIWDEAAGHFLQQNQIKTE